MPDTKTIQLILMLTELLVGFSLLVALRGNYRNGVGLWIASHFLHFIGLSLLAVREALPPAIYVAGYFFFTTATYSLGLAAFSRFLKQPCHPALIYLPPLLAPLAFQPFAHDPGMRVLVSGLFYSCQHVLIFRLIWNARGEQFGASRVLALAGYGVIIGLYLIRTILAAYYPRTVADPGFWVQPAGQTHQNANDVVVDDENSCLRSTGCKGAVHNPLICVVFCLFGATHGDRKAGCIEQATVVGGSFFWAS